MKAISDWLAEVGLQNYARVFAQNEIDFDVLPSLTEDDLQSLGLSLGARRRLRQALEAMFVRDGTGAARTQSGFPGATSTVGIGAMDTSRGERRQLTVMFCDLVGSTALSERLDPEELRNVLHEYRMRCGNVIQRYEGYVARYVGDGILAYFGWPVAHEDDAQRALRAGLDIIQALGQASVSEPLPVRLGIATGPVVVGEHAGVGDQSRLAIGSTPNLAARLQGIATSNQIVIAASTRKLVGNAFALLDLGDHELKGISEPVHAWQVVGLNAVDSRFDAATQGFLTPLVGRERELTLLKHRWHQAVTGDGQVVLLAGDPGIGKSRIVTALREYLEKHDALILKFQCSPYHIGTPLHASIEHLERTLRFRRDEDVEDKLERLEALLVDDYKRPKADVRYIAEMLSLSVGARYGALAMTPQQLKDETLRVLVEMTEASAGKRQTLLLFEDIHWADATTLELLDMLIDRATALPLFIVLTHRPEFQNRWESRDHVTALNLAKLTRAESSAIATKLANNKTLPGDLLEQIVTKTDGVPLFIEELTKTILESQEVREVDGRYEFTGNMSAITVPSTLRDSLMARLDRNQAAKEIAQIGSTIGREFSYELLAEVALRTNTEFDHALRQLTDLGLVFRQFTPSGIQYTFKHALVQDIAYDSLLKTKRQQLHQHIATALEARHGNSLEEVCELLAYHYARTTNAGKAVDYFEMANRKAIRFNAMVEARGYFIEAMRFLDLLSSSRENDRRRIALVARQMIVFLLLFATSEYYEYLERFAPLARGIGDPGLLGGYYGSMTMIECCFGEFNRAIATGRRAVELCLAGGNFVDLAEVYAALGWGYVHHGSFDAALALEDGLEQGAKHAFDFQWYAYALGAFTAAGALRGEFDRAIGFGQREFRIAQEYGDKSVMSHAAWATSWAYLYRGDMAEALVHAERAVELAPTIATKSWAYGSLGMVHCRAGNPKRAIEILAPLVPGFRGARFRMSECFTIFLCEAYLRAGKLEQATQTADELLEIIEPCDMRAWTGMTYRILGEIAELADPDKATTHFERGITLLEETGAQPELALTLRSYGRLQRRIGHKDAGETAIQRARTIAERIGMQGLLHCT